MAPLVAILFFEQLIHRQPNIFKSQTSNMIYNSYVFMPKELEKWG